MSRYAVVCDGTVTNVVLWDGESDWTPDDGCTLHRLPDDSPVSIGWGRSGNNRWTRPDVPQTPPDLVAVTVDPAALSAFLDAVADPDIDTRQALADFAAALGTSTD